MATPTSLPSTAYTIISRAQESLCPCRNSGGDGIQTRQTAVSTTFIGEDPYDGLTTCVSLNTAVAARIGEPALPTSPTLTERPIRAACNCASMEFLPRSACSAGILETAEAAFSNSFGGDLEIELPDGKILLVTPEWWASQGYWYLNVDVTHLSW